MTGQPRGHCVSCHPIHKEEAPGVATRRVRVHWDRTVRRNLDTSDIVHIKESRRVLVTRDDIESVAHIRYGRWDRT